MKKKTPSPVKKPKTSFQPQVNQPQVDLNQELLRQRMTLFGNYQTAVAVTQQQQKYQSQFEDSQDYGSYQVETMVEFSTKG